MPAVSDHASRRPQPEMISGWVNAFQEAIVRLPVLGPQGQEQAVEAVVDTGFNGHLTLPSELIAELGLPFRSNGRAVLGDNARRDVCENKEGGTGPPKPRPQGLKGQTPAASGPAQSSCGAAPPFRAPRVDGCQRTGGRGSRNGPAGCRRSQGKLPSLMRLRVQQRENATGRTLCQ